MAARVEYFSRVLEVAQKLDHIMAQRLASAGLHLQNKWREKLKGPRHGRVYRVPGTKRRYTASAPGEPPAVRTGRLRNSIRYRLVGSGLQRKAEVGTPLVYAEALEFGTQRMAPRPSLRPTWEEEKEAVKGILRGQRPP